MAISKKQKEKIFYVLKLIMLFLVIFSVIGSSVLAVLPLLINS